MPPQANVQLDALLHAAATAPLTSAWVAVTGSDRVRWLNGMVTNSVNALTPGDGAYSFLLSAQGRIQADCTVWAEPDRLLLQTSAEQAEKLLELLDRFIIMDDVELTPITLHGLLVAGPQAAEALTTAGIPARVSRLLKRRSINAQLTLLNAYSPQVPRFELWSESESDLDTARERLQLPAATEEDLELLRILEATPAIAQDIRDRELPQETAQARALHFNKGCYLGQEIVERIRSRGNVHRTFTTFVLTGTTPPPGTLLQAEGKPVGELTTIATQLIHGAQLALGYIRREALERDLALTYPGGSATIHQATAAPQPAAAAS